MITNDRKHSELTDWFITLKYSECSYQCMLIQIGQTSWILKIRNVILWFQENPQLVKSVITLKKTGFFCLRFSEVVTVIEQLVYIENVLTKL